jgi:hypothetical protein
MLELNYIRENASEVAARLAARLENFLKQAKPPKQENLKHELPI